MSKSQPAAGSAGPHQPEGPGPHQDHAGEMSAQAAEANKSGRDRNLAEQGRQGNMEQNTTHQGHQQ